MAIPVLYWMLECTECGLRRVVHDTYLEFVGTPDPNPLFGAGYGGLALPDRYPCTKGCKRGMRAIGSIFGPDDLDMWLYEPYIRVEMSEAQRAEWARLIREADLSQS